MSYEQYKNSMDSRNMLEICSAQDSRYNGRFFYQAIPAFSLSL